MGFDLQAHQELRRLSYQVNCLVRDFCCKVKKCIGISNTGDPNLVLNQQGNWVSGGSSNIIEIQKSAFLQLVTDSELDYPKKYKITDIDNGLYIDTLNNNTFSKDATISLFVPNYTASGLNLGQMDFSNIPELAPSEYVIWGDHYWRNDDVVPVTPSIIDDISLMGLTQLIKETGSIYDALTFNCTVDNILGVSFISNGDNVSIYKFPSAVLSFLQEKSYIYAPLNANFIANSDVTIVRNQLSDVNNGDVLGGFTTNEIFTSAFSQNKGMINGAVFMGSQNEFSNNEGVFSTIQLVNGSRFKNNKSVGNITNQAHAGIGFIELWDNCEILNNQCLGDFASIWDVRTGENSKVNNNIINGNWTESGNSYVGFADIDQMQSDEVNDNAVNGDNVQIEIINQLGYSKFNNNKFNGNIISGQKWSNFQMQRSEITNTLINADDIIWKDLSLVNTTITNAEDIQIQNCSFRDINLDLTGFTNDITSETIQSGKGWFTATYNFSTNPLIVGNPVSLNIIPINWRITDIKAIGLFTGGAGAVLDLGLENDDESLISDVVANYSTGKTFSGFSKQAAANRGLSLKSSFADITGGNINILVEFTV